MKEGKEQSGDSVGEDKTGEDGKIGRWEGSTRLTSVTTTGLAGGFGIVPNDVAWMRSRMGNVATRVVCNVLSYQSSGSSHSQASPNWEPGPMKEGGNEVMFERRCGRGLGGQTRWDVHLEAGALPKKQSNTCKAVPCSVQSGRVQCAYIVRDARWHALGEETRSNGDGVRKREDRTH